MYRLLAIVFCTIGLAGISGGMAQAECRLSVRVCTSTCPVQQGVMANACTPSCGRYIICDIAPDRSASSRLPKGNLPQGRLPQGQLPTSQMPVSAFN